MAKAQSVKYSVLAADGKDWTPRGQTMDMTAALSAARALLSSNGAPRVRVEKEWLDTTSGRNVTAIIFDEKASTTADASKGGAMRWIIIAVVMFGLGFGGVYAAKTFFL